MGQGDITDQSISLHISSNQLQGCLNAATDPWVPPIVELQTTFTGHHA